jgi:hypothetical protein
VLILFLQTGDAVTNNTSTSLATASIAETISVTLSGTINFANLMPGSENNTASSNLTIQIDDITNVATNITQKGNTTFECTACNPVDNFTIDNLRYADNFTLPNAVNMTATYSAPPFANWTNIPKPSVGVPAIKEVDYWLSVPIGQSAGSYATDIYINVTKY